MSAPVYKVHRQSCLICAFRRTSTDRTTKTGWASGRTYICGHPALQDKEPERVAQYVSHALLKKRPAPEPDWEKAPDWCPALLYEEGITDVLRKVDAE